MIQGVRQGSGESFGQLYDEYADKVYAYIVRRINNHHDAEDLTADVFIKAFSNPYNPRLAKFSTYVFTIAANVLKNHYRAATVRKIVVPAVADEDANSSDFSFEPDILAGLITREECDELKNALAKLPLRQYDVVYRRYYLDESFKKIGTAMGITETNARQLHFEAIKKMKNILKSP